MIFVWARSLGPKKGGNQKKIVDETMKKDASTSDLSAISNDSLHRNNSTTSTLIQSKKIDGYSSQDSNVTH